MNYSHTYESFMFINYSLTYESFMFMNDSPSRSFLMLILTGTAVHDRGAARLARLAVLSSGAEAAAFDTQRHLDRLGV